MSENDQKITTAPAGEQKNHGRGRNQWRKRRHRPSNRPQNDAKGEMTEQASPAAAEVPAGEGTATAKPKNANRQGSGNQKQNQNNNHNRTKKKQQNDRKNTGNKGGNGSRQARYEKRPYDPYEAPSREEIALSELRAQIVLQSADGTAPVPYGTAPSTQPTEEAEPLLLPADGEQDTAADNEPGVEVIGIRFRTSGKMYYFDPNGKTAKKGDYAIVETTRGPEFGEVCMGNNTVKASAVVTPLRPLLRIASAEDIAHNEENRKKEQDALKLCATKIAAHGLEMKLIDAQYAFDNSKLLFYFSAEGRVDFRELVKDLASVFRTRIELRQIGIRDEAKMLGGIGACGRLLCCSTFLPDFAQVSIKMAKEQSLSLNSSKISGVCGRLLCCLRYESDVYAEETRRTPSVDSLVRTEDGVGTVVSNNPLAGTVRVVLKNEPDATPKQYHRDSVVLLGREKKGGDRKSEATEEATEKAEN